MKKYNDNRVNIVINASHRDPKSSSILDYSHIYKNCDHCDSETYSIGKNIIQCDGCGIVYEKINKNYKLTKESIEFLKKIGKI